MTMAKEDTTSHEHQPCAPPFSSGLGRAQELCIRFHNGMAVQVHSQTGSLMAIRQKVMARSDAFQLDDGLQAG